MNKKRAVSITAKKNCIRLTVFLHLIVVAISIYAADDPLVYRKFDVLYRNAIIFDGTGAARFSGDVGINGDRIAAVGDLSMTSADREINLDGRYLAPGFIDLHAHVTDGYYGANGLMSRNARRRAAPNYVFQGVTTVLGNPDGYQTMDMAEQRASLTENGVGPNVALTNGHNGLRAMVMGEDQQRPATEEEIAAMRDIIIRDMQENGSFGLSAGTEYFSGMFSTGEEQIELAKPLAAYNGIFIAHMRSQGDSPMWYTPSEYPGLEPPTLEDAMNEVFAVAAETGAIAVMTHMKAW